MFGGGSGYTVTAVFPNAGQLVKGNYVEVAGRPVGKVKSIKLDENAQARVKLSVGSGFDPLHQGTTAVIRASSLSGIANRYIELQPGPNSAPKIDDGGLISADKTQSPVDLDQLFNTLDPKTRKGLQGIVQGSAAQYEGKSAKAAEAIRYFNPALSTSARIARELVLDRQSFQRFVSETAQTVSALDERRPELAALVGNANTTAKAICDANGHYARIQPIFNQFQETDLPGVGPVLTPLTGDQKGRNGLVSHKSLRCPGAATQPAPDGSNPWPDDAPGCNPAYVPPGP